MLMPLIWWQSKQRFNDKLNKRFVHLPYPGTSTCIIMTHSQADYCKKNKKQKKPSKILQAYLQHEYKKYYIVFVKVSISSSEFTKVLKVVAPTKILGRNIVWNSFVEFSSLLNALWCYNDLIRIVFYIYPLGLIIIPYHIQLDQSAIIFMIRKISNQQCHDHVYWKTLAPNSTSTCKVSFFVIFGCGLVQVFSSLCFRVASLMLIVPVLV